MELPPENNIESKILPIVQFEQKEPTLTPVNEWSLSEGAISSRVDYSIEYEMNAFHIPLFHFAMEAPQESEQEKQEKDVAIKEQIAAGILKLWPMAGNPGQCLIGLPNQPPPGADLNQATAQQQPPKNRANFPIFNSIGPMKMATIDPKVLQAKKNYDDSLLKNKKIGPNDKCPCGSKIKYKRCHGRHLNRG